MAGPVQSVDSFEASLGKASQIQLPISTRANNNSHERPNLQNPFVSCKHDQWAISSNGPEPTANRFVNGFDIIF